MDQDTLPRRIDALKRERGALILAHNYQRPEVQEIADLVGDSLDLARSAAASDREVIVFCGVDFMAETVKILSPDKKVLIPRADATCPMAAMITAADVKRLRAANPGAVLVAYVNTTAEVKAECDICCTSANAVRVVSALHAERTILVPDRNLASWVRQETGKDVNMWDGHCYVHEAIDEEEVVQTQLAFPTSTLVVHPECTHEVRWLADAVLSTNGMARLARSSPWNEFIVGTEEGLMHRLRRENPGKRFHPAGRATLCEDMKRTRLEDVLASLRDGIHEVTVPHETTARARAAVEFMLRLA